MTPEQIELARHALGLDGTRKMSYRNHFVTGQGSSDHAPWVTMVEAGDAVRRRGSELTGGDDLFRLTLQGARAALRVKEKLDPEDFPEAARNDASVQHTFHHDDLKRKESMSEHCGECGSQVCGHGACPECNPCRNCDGGERSNKRFDFNDHRYDARYDGEDSHSAWEDTAAPGDYVHDHLLDPEEFLS